MKSTLVFTMVRYFSGLRPRSQVEQQETAKCWVLLDGDIHPTCSLRILGTLWKTYKKRVKSTWFEGQLFLWPFSAMWDHQRVSPQSRHIYFPTGITHTTPFKLVGWSKCLLTTVSTASWMLWYAALARALIDSRWHQLVSVGAMFTIGICLHGHVALWQVYLAMRIICIYIYTYV